LLAATHKPGNPFYKKRTARNILLWRRVYAVVAT
jgi:hypothetical protein